MALNRIGGERWRFIVRMVLLSAMIASASGLSRAHGATLVTFSYFANYLDNEMWRKICEGFEQENPDVKIKRLWYVGDTGRKLQLQLISNTAADIILMDDEVFPAYGVRGYLEDLKPYIERRSDPTERDLADELRYLEAPEEQRDTAAERVFLPTALQSFYYRGLQGGLPWDGNAVVMFYNKDVFDQAGIPYPSKDWTMAEFRATAKKLTKDFDHDGRIDQYGTALACNLLAVEPLVWSFGGEMLSKDQTKCALQEREGLEALQFIYDMKYKDRSIAWAGETQSFTVDVQLLTGRLGMFPVASHVIPTLARVKDAMRWGVANMPIGPHGQRYTRVTWDGMSINSATSPEKKEIAWKFLKYLIGDRSQALIGGLKRGFPVRRAQAVRDYVGTSGVHGEDVALEATSYGKLTPVTPRYMELRDAFNGELEKLNVAEHTGATPAKVLPELASKVNRVLQKELDDWASQVETAKKTAQARPDSSLKALGLMTAIIGGVLGLLLLFRPVRAMLAEELRGVRNLTRSRSARVRAFEGILFASPWLLGMCLFTAFPILFSVVLSFSDWDPYTSIASMTFVGLDNFRKAFSTDPVTGDPLVLKALYNTFYYAFFAVPLGLIGSLGLAILLNQKVRGISIFRTTFYLPSIVSGVATVILWTYIFNPMIGPLNGFLHFCNTLLEKSVVLAFIHLPEPQWLSDPSWAKPALILMSLWGAGGAGMLIFLAGLQGVPDQLYEVAELDGAGRLRMFWNITLPMLTPTIYFNLIMGIISALKVFMQAYIMTDGSGGVDKSLLFFVLHLYNKAFVEFDMGYASALAWILFMIILALTLLIIRSSAMWVYYEGEKRR